MAVSEGSVWAHRHRYGHVDPQWIVAEQDQVVAKAHLEWMHDSDLFPGESGSQARENRFEQIAWHWLGPRTLNDQHAELVGMR